MDGMKKGKERAVKPHYMLARQPQADMTYVDVRTHTANKSHRGVEKQREACRRKYFHR